MKKIFPHIFVLLAFVLLATLGTWQVMRREWKQHEIAKLDANINQAPINEAGFKNIKDDEFKKMQVTGIFQHQNEFLLQSKPYNGKPGQHVITPIKTTNDKIILVNRGWVPSDKEPAKYAETKEITGVIRASQKLNSIGKLIIFDNSPKRKVWFWIDLPEMYKSIGAPTQDYYLDMLKTDDSKSYPYALPAKIELYNEHLQYAITWYSLSIVLLLVYYFRFWKK